MPLETSSFDTFRDLALPPTRLWDVLTNPEMRCKWGGPDETMVLEVVSGEAKVGSTDLLRCGPAEAPEFEIATRWYDLTEPERAVFTETLIFGGAPVSTSLVTYALEAAGNGTALGITVAVSSFSGPEALEEIKQGWEGGLENLSRFVAQTTADA